MNKQAISLVEVLVAVMLISVVIVSLLQIKENNLTLLDKLTVSSKLNSYISIIALKNDNKEGMIYLDQELYFKDDDIRKSLKDIKIEVKNKTLSPLKFEVEKYKIQIDIKQTVLSIDDTFKKQFYTFTIVN